jgi:hypothetical protein
MTSYFKKYNTYTTDIEDVLNVSGINQNPWWASKDQNLYLKQK